MENIFTNNIFIKTDINNLKNVLANLDNLKNWIPEISIVKDDTKKWTHIVRSGQSINSSEYIEVEDIKDCVIYHSFGGAVKYDLIFKLQKSNGGVKLQQNVNIFNFPMSKFEDDILISIAKKAFSMNLQNLKNICEEGENSIESNYAE